jgi:hypothetical protein
LNPPVFDELQGCGDLDLPCQMVLNAENKAFGQALEACPNLNLGLAQLHSNGF